MNITYKLYRSKYPDQVFNSETIKFVIENDDHLAALDEILQHMLTQHIQDLPEIKKYGIAYVHRMCIEELEITKEDNVNLSKEAFEHYISTLGINIPVKWSI